MADIVYRENADKKYTADLTKLCKNEEDFLNKLESLKIMVKELYTYKGKLKDKKVLKEFLVKKDEYEQILEKVFLYQSLLSDLIFTDPKVTEIVSKFRDFVNCVAQYEFMRDEYFSFDEDYIKDIINDKDFENYKSTFCGLLEDKKCNYFLEQDKNLIDNFMYETEINKLIAKFANSPMHDIVDDNGNVIQLDSDNYRKIMAGTDTHLKENAIKSFYDKYLIINQDVANLYIEEIKLQDKIAKNNNFKSCLDMELYKSDLPKELFNNITKIAHDNLGILEDYNNTIKFLLGKAKDENLTNWDNGVGKTINYNPIDIDWSFDNGCKVLKQALAPLGEDYVNMIDVAVKERWIDVYPSKNKAKQQYQITAANTPIYIVLNYKNNQKSLSALAHEFGHAMFSYYSKKNQCKQNSIPSILCQEVASFTNEILFINYLIQHTSSNDKKAVLMSNLKLLNFFETEFFKTCMWSEFELFARNCVNKGETLTAEMLNQKYGELLKLYNPYTDIVNNKEKSWVYSSITLQQKPFYNWQYSASMICAIKFAKDIISGDKEKIANYRKFLTLGSSDSSLELLKQCGVDLTTNQPYQEAFDFIREIVAENALLAKEIKKEMQQENQKDEKEKETTKK